MTLGELFSDIAKAIRSKDGTTGSIPALTFPERIRALSGGGGGGGDGSPYVVNVPVNISVSVSVTVEDYVAPKKDYALYNGVRLPSIPEDVLESYPYAAIIRYEDNTYHLWAFTSKLYYGSNRVNIPACSYASYDVSGDKWILTGTYTSSSYFAVGTTLVWSNFDVLNGSTIYFAGSEPVPTD